MKVLVTGAAGFIGSHLAERLVHDGHEVVGFDNLSTGNHRNIDRLGGAIQLLQGDLRSKDDVARAVRGVEVVYHQAALASVPQSIIDPETTFDVNVTGTLNLLIAARDAGVRRVVFASSSSVYGDSDESPKHERLTPMPLSPYAISKLTGEQLCTVFNSLYNIETVALRYFNVYGPRQDPDSPYAAVIPKFFAALSRGERPLVFGDGEQSRGFVFVDDVVRGNLLAGAAKAAAGMVINISSDHSVTINHCLELICRIHGVAVNADYRPSRPGDIRHSTADVSLARSVLGWSPLVQLEQGLESTSSAY